MDRASQEAQFDETGPRLHEKPRLLALALVMVTLLSGLAVQAEVLSFEEWKGQRLDAAKAAYDKVFSEISSSSTAFPSPAGSAKASSPRVQGTGARVNPTSNRTQPSPRGARLDLQLQSAQQAIELAQELSVSDYLVLYLARLKDRGALVDAAKRLSPEQTADLLEAMQRTLAVPSIGSGGGAPSSAGAMPENPASAVR
jgi:hypothetical protein